MYATLTILFWTVVVLILMLGWAALVDRYERAKRHEAARKAREFEDHVRTIVRAELAGRRKRKL